MNDHSVS